LVRVFEMPFWFSGVLGLGSWDLFNFVNLGASWGNWDTLLVISVKSLEIWGFWRGILEFGFRVCCLRGEFRG
jgi:hypothetical protein